MRRRLLALLALASPAGAQFVTPKTVPVRTGEQFGIFPSARAGMGGVRIALDDTLADPFVNPARATRVGSPVVFGAPFFHDVSAGGGGRTVPLGAAGSGARWGAAGTVAFQQIDRAGPTWNLSTSERTAVNRYATGALARRFGDGLAVGIGAYTASLRAVDGVDLLYAGSDRVDQSGSLVDLRLGATKRWRDGRALDVLLLHNRTDVTHDVHFTTRTWDQAARVSHTVGRDEHNVDRTHAWGVHGQYAQPVGREGWRIGGIASATRLSHPKIPNYVIMNIPRDPGTTYGANLGVGAARQVGRTSFGLDVVYEPITSDTWAAAERDTSVVPNVTVRAGEHTVDNALTFSNLRLRLGAGRAAAARDTGSSFGYQVGLAAYAIDYRLRQSDHLRRTTRTQNEHWVEWSPTFGLQWRTRELDVRYTYRLTCQGGSGDCLGRRRVDFPTVVDVAPGTGGIIAAPSAPLRFDGGRASTHQVAIVVPIR